MNDPHRLTRRHCLAGGAAGLALGLAGCAARPEERSAYPRPYSRQPWAAPRISPSAVIREVVGHRPYRPAGFRVESERLDDTLVVHNYGHGGGGLSLGWGSSALAVREVAGQSPGKVAVLGSGIMGLTTARLLQDAGWSVTIYTRDVYRHTTSNVAAGEWGPFSTHDEARVDETFRSRLTWAAQVSHHAYTNLVGPKYGIRFLEEYQFRSRRPELSAPGPIEKLFAYRGVIGPGEHPFGERWAVREVTLQIDPGTLLRQLTADVQLAGGRFDIRHFSRLDEVLALDEDVVFNCTGLGARALFGDEGLVPIKGQLVFLPPDPAVDYMTIGGGDGLLYMFPRSDVLLLGGTYRMGDWSRNVEPDETERIVSAHQALFSDFG